MSLDEVVMSGRAEGSKLSQLAGELHASGNSDVGALDTRSDPQTNLPKLLSGLLPAAPYAKSIDIIHCSTLFSEPAFTGAGELSSLIRERIELSREYGVTAWYAVGAMQRSAFSKQILPHFSREWHCPPPKEFVGPSVFSIDRLRPISQIGSWRKLAKLSEKLKAEGVELILDFVPNTIGLSSPYVIRHPDIVLDYYGEVESLTTFEAMAQSEEHMVYGPHDADCPHVGDGIATRVYRFSETCQELIHYQNELPDGVFNVYARRFIGERSAEGFSPYAWVTFESNADKQTYCKQLGREHPDGGTVWGDVFMLNRTEEKVHQLQGLFIKRLHDAGIETKRVDMAHLPHDEYWDALRLQHQKPIESIGESYHEHNDRRLRSRGMATYASAVRELLREGPNIDGLNHLIFSSCMKDHDGNSVVFTATHDDPHQAACPKEGALLATAVSLPFRHVMFAQGQRYGVPMRFGADMHVSMNDFTAMSSEYSKQDPGYVEFVKRLYLLSRAQVLRDPASLFWRAHIDGVNRDTQNVFAIARHLEAHNERLVFVADHNYRKNDSSITLHIGSTFEGGNFSTDTHEIIELVSGDIIPYQDEIACTADHGFWSKFFYIKER